MKTIRNSGFETNSSSCHVVTVLSDDEIVKENREAAIAALEEKKAELEGQIKEKTRSMRYNLKKINSEIDSLKKVDK